MDLSFKIDLSWVFVTNILFAVVILGKMQLGGDGVILSNVLEVPCDVFRSSADGSATATDGIHCSFTLCCICLIICIKIIALTLTSVGQFHRKMHRKK